MNVRLFKKDGYDFVSSDDFILNLDLMNGRVVFSHSLVQQDIKEEDDEFVYVPFRALSKIIIPGYWINLTKGNVLKNSVKILKGKTVYPNHDTDVTKWLGLVDDASWDESKEPNGINTVLKLDKSNDRIIKGIRMNAINSVSVQMGIKWEKSHANMDNWDFWINEGREIDGKIVSKVVNEITDYSEISLVYKGADPHAKKLSYLTPTLSKGEGAKGEGVLEKENKLKLKKTANAMIQNFGGYEVRFGDKDEVEISQEDFDSILASLTTRMKSLEKQADIGRKHIAELRQNVEKNYRLCVEEPNEKILELIHSDSLGYAGLQAMHMDYERRLEEKFVSTSSTNGGSTSRQSSVIDLKDSEGQNDIKVEEYVC